MTAREEVYAVLVALANDTLLLPNAAVAEVVSADPLEPAGANMPARYAGRITWNNRELPVVRFEALNGGAPGETTRRTRLAIVHGITDRLRTGQYAIVCQGYPHLVTLNRKAMRSEPRQRGDVDAMVLARVGIANTNALIPNLEAVEAQLATFEAA